MIFDSHIGGTRKVRLVFKVSKWITIINLRLSMWIIWLDFLFKLLDQLSIWIITILIIKLTVVTIPIINLLLKIL